MTGLVEVHHRIDGAPDAPALVLCNSLATTLTTWDPQVPTLAERFRVIRYDLRGHGGSPGGTAPFDVSDLGGDLVSLLDRLDVPRAHLCGLSLGGIAAMWVAARAPERVSRLVLCSTAPRIGTRESWRDRAATVRAHGMDAIAERVLRIWFTDAYRSRDPDGYERMRAMLRSTDADVYAAHCDLLGSTDLRPQLPAISAPSLALAGSADPSTPPILARAMAEAIHGCRVATLDGAAHLANVERPESFTRMVQSHLLDTTTQEDR